MIKGKTGIISLIVVAAAAVFLFAGRAFLLRSAREGIPGKSSIVFPDSAEPESEAIVPDSSGKMEDEKGPDSYGKTGDSQNLVIHEKTEKGTEPGQQSKGKVLNDAQNPSGQAGSVSKAAPEEIKEALPAVISEEVKAKAEALAGRKVEIKDLVRVAEIFLKKMSLSEIKLLYDAAKDDVFLNSSVEEINKVREIVFSKLSPQDLEVIRTIGRKYNKDLRIIDPDISVEEEKQNTQSVCSD